MFALQRCSYLLLTVSLISFFSGAAMAQEPVNHWNNFRGPGGNGVAAESATPPVEWSGDSENLKWKQEIPGRGSSSPIVWEDKIYLLTAVPKAGEGQPEAQPQEQQRPQRGRRGRGGRGRQAPASLHEFYALCIDRTSGEIVWQTKVNETTPHERGHQTNTFASSAVVTDGKHIYASFGSFGIYCLDMAGEVVWERNFGQMRTRNQFGEGASPALFQDTVVINWDHEDQSYIYALDALTGEDKWKNEREELTSWSTPLIVQHGDKVQVITNGATRVRSYNLENGEIIWECGGQTGNPIPTPMLFEETAICMTGWRGCACFAIPLDSEGDVTGSSDIVWSRNDIGPYVPTGVLYKGRIYSTKNSRSFLACVDAATGETVFDFQRLNGIETLYASLVAANDHIYVTGRTGNTVVLKHADEMEVAHTNELGEAVDATPAIVDNQIFIRGEKHLFCFENSGR